MSLSKWNDKLRVSASHIFSKIDICQQSVYKCMILTYYSLHFRRPLRLTERTKESFSVRKDFLWIFCWKVVGKESDTEHTMYFGVCNWIVRYRSLLVGV